MTESTKPRNPNLRPPWQKGCPSPNPSGRTKAHAEIKKVAQDLASAVRQFNAFAGSVNRQLAELAKGQADLFERTIEHQGATGSTGGAETPPAVSPQSQMRQSRPRKPQFLRTTTPSSRSRPTAPRAATTSARPKPGLYRKRRLGF
jgi:hypothetical protein